MAAEHKQVHTLGDFSHRRALMFLHHPLPVATVIKELEKEEKRQMKEREKSLIRGHATVPVPKYLAGSGPSSSSSSHQPQRSVPPAHNNLIQPVGTEGRRDVRPHC
ncbi:unnamed protein product [Pleuronectes platessa]|uniref:Uncharacterized protein n=1 Tax=Pleuronectes platessa TaxID=8262 RepID=A0A9N7UI91_PLEPL|nr:unnamed protein product [Pleuronectes platessa]